jgi:hypothetical protein
MINDRRHQWKTERNLGIFDTISGFRFKCLNWVSSFYVDSKNFAAMTAFKFFGELEAW